MAYLLDSTTIKNPTSGGEVNATQYAQQQTLAGAIGRDYFGDNKRVWKYDYINCNKTDYNIIRAIYDSYLSTGNAKDWQVTETNYSVATTTVHIDLQERSFSVKGTDYLSDFTLILTEA